MTSRKQETPIDISLKVVMGKGASPTGGSRARSCASSPGLLPACSVIVLSLGAFVSPAVKSILYTEIFGDKMPQKAQFHSISFPELMQMV